MSSASDREWTQRAHGQHSAAFGVPAAAVAFAPGRVNLIGEHIDYNGGSVLPIALAQGTAAAVSRRADARIAVTSTLAGGTVLETYPADFDPAASNGWLAYVVGAVAVATARGWYSGGVNISLDSDVPLGAGLSSSASLECAILTALTALGGGYIPPMEVALAAQQVEHEYAHVPCGIMDQAASMLARPGDALLLDTATLTTRQVPLHLADMGLSILLVDTRVSHELTDGGYAARRADCEAAAQLLGVTHLVDLDPTDPRIVALPAPLDRRTRHVVGEQARVAAAVQAFADADVEALGQLFADSHASLAADYEVSCAELDLAVDAAVRGGAAAARMTGGGFGGSAVVLCRPDRAQAVQAEVLAAFAGAGFGVPTIRTVEAAGGARLLHLARPLPAP